MNPQPLVSIIIGLYNVERFLDKKRLRDVLDQTYRNLEIILVDDGSTDNTPSIADELAKADSRIHVIHKVNGGVGSARNVGLDVATGDYVCFFDVDDDLHFDMVERSVKLMQQHQAEMLVFGFNVRFISDAFTDRTIKFPDRTIQSNDELKSIVVDQLLDIFPVGNGFVWNKVYQRSFLEKHQLRFPELRLQQDEVFNMRVYPNVNRLVMSSEVLYDYYVYESGNNRSRFIPDRFQLYYSIYSQLEELGLNWGIMDNHYRQFVDEKLYQGMTHVLMVSDFLKENKMSQSDRKKHFMEILNNDDVQGCVDRIGHSAFLIGIKAKCIHPTFRNRNYSLFLVFRQLFKWGDCVRSFLRQISSINGWQKR